MNFSQQLLHERCQRILFGSYPEAAPSLILECCDEWVLKGHKIPTGVVKYFEAYFI